jgi:hypothetical protein
LSVWGVHKAIERGELHPVARGPIKVSAADVEQMRRRKQDEAIARVGADRLLKLARDVRAQLQPPVTAGGRRGHAALELVSETVKAAFGMPLLHACAMPDGSGCRWCAAEAAGRILGAPVRLETLSSEFGFTLLGGPQCERHRAFMAGRMRELAERVHPGGARPPVPRTAPVTAAGSAPPAAPSVPRRAPVQPVQPDDGGKSMVQRRLRETRARLVMARRSGDQKYALKLRTMVQSLEQDAAQVDVRAVTAAARTKPRVARFMGNKACGTPVGTPCSCHPGPKRRGRR